MHDEPASLTSNASGQRAEASPLGLALGRVPSGLFILTVRQGERATGMLTSWVQQAGFEPPMLTVAVRLNRYVGDWIAASERFTLNQIAAGHKPLIRHFARGFPPDADAFECLTVREGAQGGPILAEALSYLDCELAGHLDGGDHRIFLARVVAGALLDPSAEPLVHVRHSGHHY
ncbi:MAG TPA: flavin reductase family protein [Isosphaeraceae bacterium]|jgi:flavin reductase (DIM6/NTAB) family NADH-FMN oxidoreductase RutF|nr:flavin reductase family protein [Isosphaeraceae bacterium]